MNELKGLELDANSGVVAQEGGGGGIPSNKRSMKLERMPWNFRGLNFGRRRRLIRNILHTWNYGKLM